MKSIKRREFAKIYNKLIKLNEELETLKFKEEPVLISNTRVDLRSSINNLTQLGNILGYINKHGKVNTN